MKTAKYQGTASGFRVHNPRKPLSDPPVNAAYIETHVTPRVS